MTFVQHIRWAVGIRCWNTLSKALHAVKGSLVQHINCDGFLRSILFSLFFRSFWDQPSARPEIWSQTLKSDFKVRRCPISKTGEKKGKKRPAQKWPPGKGQNPWNSAPTPVAREGSGADAFPLATRQTVWLPAWTSMNPTQHSVALDTGPWPAPKCRT